MGLPKEEVPLRVIIEEQRRNHDYLLRIYDRAGAKENVLLTATFAILIYLYSTPSDPTAGVKKSIAERLFFPGEDYGRVIYLIAASFFLYGLFKLMFNVFGDSKWETAYETQKTDYKDDMIENLRYVKRRHDKAMVTNKESYDKRKSDLKFCFYCLLISAIILIVIKTLN